MKFAKIFLGENQKSASIDEALFNKLFHIGANKDLFIIKSKIPIPSQDISDQHVHDNFEFTIPLSHNPKLMIHNKEFMLPQRNIFPCNPGQSHGPAEAAHQHRIIALQASSSLIEDVAYTLYGTRNIIFKNIPIGLDHNLDNLFDLFIFESNNKQAGYEFILDNLSIIIVATIVRSLKSNLGIYTKPFNGVKNKNINKIFDYLHSNSNKDFSLNELADSVGLSKYHLIRQFKIETGKTPYQYYLDLKIAKAVQLIRTSNYSITEICFMSGFKDHSHFSKVFTKKMGISPSRFRALC